jgi:hypothetical protein
VLRRLERISGLAVKYESASLDLASGQYHITNLRFIDPAQPHDPVLAVEEVYATIHPWELLTNPESTISRVVLKNPSRLDLIYSQRSIKLGEKSQFLLDAVRKAQPPGSKTAGNLPFQSLKIENVEVAFTESAGILPDDTPATASLRLRGDMELENEGRDALGIAFTGGAAQASAHGDGSAATMASGVNASLTLNPDESMCATGSIRGLALHEIFRDNPNSWLRANDIKFDLATSRTQASRGIAGWASMGKINLLDPERTVTLQDENLRLTSAIDINTSAGETTIRSATLESAGAALSVHGNTSFSPSKPSYSLAVSGSRLDEDYRVILERFLPQGWDFDSAPEKLAFDLAIASVDGVLRQLNGVLKLRGVQVKTPDLPVSLQNLFGDIQFSADGITIKDVTADYAGARVALDGTFRGDPWTERAGHLALNWSAIVDVAKIMQLHGGQLPGGKQVGASGRISGNGTWQQDINLRDAGASGVPQVEGGFDFENVAFDDPRLPGPITNLSGRATVDDDLLSVKNLTGKLRGNEMTVDGLLQGSRFFWRDPQVSATLTSKLDLTHLEDYLPANTRKQADAYQLTGLAETRMAVNGPIGNLGSNFTGVMHLEEVGFLPGLSFMEGRISDVSGVVRWNGTQLTLSNLLGKVNGETVAFDGTIAAGNIDLRVKSDASLDAVQKTFPGLGRFLEMSGGLSTDLRFSAGNDKPSPARSLSEMIGHARALLDESVKNQSFALNGELRLDGASMRHIAMPPARTEAGNKIPAGRVTDMTGTVVINNDTLSVPAANPITCAFSDTPDCRLSGQVKLRAGNLPAMQVSISTRGTLKLDPWIIGWGKDLPRPDKPPMSGKTFDLDADIQAGQLLLRGQRGGRSRGKLSFKLVQDESPRVTQFHEVVVQGFSPGTGRVVGSGRIESFVWNPQQFPRWQTNIDVQAMPLDAMLSAVFVEPSNLRGLVSSGQLRLEGVGNNARSIRGNGSAYIQNLEMGRTAVIRQLGQTTGRNFGGMLFETAQAATFQIGNGALSSRDLALQTNGLQLEMHGDYWFAADPARGIAAKTIDGSLRLKLFKSVFGAIPIIGQVADLADEVTNAFLLAFRVTGTADNPQVTPVALPVFQGGS